MISLAIFGEEVVRRALIIIGRDEGSYFQGFNQHILVQEVGGSPLPIPQDQTWKPGCFLGGTKRP